MTQSSAVADFTARCLQCISRRVLPNEPGGITGTAAPDRDPVRSVVEIRHDGLTRDDKESRAREMHHGLTDPIVVTPDRDVLR